jgi:GTP-binding protein
MGKKMTGARGAEAIVEVPPGTSVSDAADGRLIADAVDSRIQMVLVRGGRGGRGNVRFKRSVRRTPRFAERGEVGQSRTLHPFLE